MASGRRVAAAVPHIRRRTPPCGGRRIVTSWLPDVHRRGGSVAAAEPGVIATIPVFSHLSREQQDCVAGACRELEVEAGTKLTQEGEFGYAMFAVTQGTADVFIEEDLIRTLGPGDVFGEIAVFFGGRRTATVVATTPMRLIMLFNAELARLDRDVPEVADALRHTVAERLESR